MSKALESALNAVRRMSPGSEIDRAQWEKVLQEITRAVKESRPGEKS